jgi:hypothetical protein
MNENLTGPAVSNDWHGKTHLGQIFTIGADVEETMTNSIDDVQTPSIS